MRIKITGVRPTHTIACIKALRACTGLGLADARDIVNEVLHGAHRTIDVSREPKDVECGEYLTYEVIRPEFNTATFLGRVDAYAAIAPDMTLREFAAFLRVIA